jgi:hypothetical protein
MNSRWYRYLLLTLVLCSTMLVAETPPTLTARPGLCILSSTEAEECEMVVRLDWHAAQAGDWCLHSSQQETTLQCWQQQFSGHISTKVIASANVVFWLQRPSVDTRLSRVTVQIVRLARRSPERRRRRHVWSVL